MTTIFFDMDGTIADLYGVENWLDYLVSEKATPYQIAKPLLKLNLLARLLNQLKIKGYKVGIISWLAKNSTPDYDKKVTKAKKDWLNKHLASVEFDEINIVPYGTKKNNFKKTPNDILFDDEIQNIEQWAGNAFPPCKIIETLKTLQKIA